MKVCLIPWSGSNTYKDAGKSAQYAVINAIKDKYTHLVMPDFHNDGGDMVSVSFDPKTCAHALQPLTL